LIPFSPSSPIFGLPSKLLALWIFPGRCLLVLAISWIRDGKLRLRTGLKKNHTNDDPSLMTTPVRKTVTFELTVSNTPPLLLE
jgi:hypothetical protein